MDLVRRLIQLRDGLRGNQHPLTKLVPLVTPLTEDILADTLHGEERTQCIHEASFITGIELVIDVGATAQSPQVV